MYSFPPASYTLKKLVPSSEAWKVIVVAVQEEGVMIPLKRRPPQVIEAESDAPVAMSRLLVSKQLER